MIKKYRNGKKFILFDAFSITEKKLLRKLQKFENKTKIYKMNYFVLPVME